ncbi:hypothetical protein [Allosphingosinicella indica]|nr:hypothetical protein [Allosphingosinicella indica]
MLVWLRKILTWVLVSCIGAIVVAVVSEFFIEAARQKGWYLDAGQKWDRVAASTVAILTSSYVLYPLTALGGLVAGAWLDTWLAKVDRSNSDREKTGADALEHHLTQTFSAIGQALGSHDAMTYELAVSQSETLLMGLNKWNDFAIPNLRTDGAEAGTLRAFLYLNTILAPLRLGDDSEVRARAIRAVPLLNAKSATELRREMELSPRDEAEVPWWHGIQSFSIKRAACLVAGISEDAFHGSVRANAVADEIVHLVNEGHMPLAFEEKPLALNVRLPGDPPTYPRKNVALNAAISKRTLDKIAHGRGWTLPWSVVESEEVATSQSQDQSGLLNR